jgi:hypothetical protein
MNSTSMIHTEDNGVRLTTRDSTSISTRVGDTRKHKIRDNIIQEETWNLDKMMTRFNFISSVPCPAATPSHTVLAQYRVPQDLITNGLTAAPFNNFIFWNGRAKVQFQITGSPMTQGCIAAVYVPLTQPLAATDNQIKNFSSLSVNQTCYLFPNANTVAEMEIPFNSPQAYLNIASSSIDSTINTLGHIYLVVFNEVALSASTTDSVAVSVFSHFTDNNFKVPRRTVPATFLVPQSKSSLVGNMAHLLLPDNPLADAIDLAAGLFGLDNPIDPAVKETDKVLTTQRMNFSQGPELIDRLTTNPSKTSAVTSDTFATLQDEMSLDYLKKKLSYLGTFTMKTSNAVGDILASFPLNPCPNRMDLTSDNQVPLLQYISMPFNFWKGSLTYKVQVISTSFQTGKIFFSFNFNEFSPSPSTILAATTSQYGTAIELNQGSNTFEFTVPYVAVTPELYVPNGNFITDYNTLGMMNVSVINPLISPNGSPSLVQFNVFIAGGDDFELSTLTATNNVAPSFKLSPPPPPFKNQKLAFLEHNNNDDFIYVLKPQSASQPLITPMSNIDLSTEDMVAPNSTSEERKDVGQTYAPTFRDLLKKYHLYQRLTVKAPTISDNGVVWSLRLNDLFGPPTTSTGVPPSTKPPIQLLWHLIQPLYRQFKGSLNFKIMLDTKPGGVDQHFSIFYQPPIPKDTATLSDFEENLRNQLYLPPTLAPATYNGRTTIQAYPVSTRLPISYLNSLNTTAEFSIPFSSRFLSVLSKSSSLTENYLANNELTDLGRLFIYADFPNSTSTLDTDFRFNIFFSFGDDARLGTLYSIPYLSPNAITNAEGISVSSPFPDAYETAAPVVNTLVIL